MSNFLSLFGFEEGPSHLASSLECTEEFSSMEKIEDRVKRTSERIKRINEEINNSTPKSSNKNSKKQETPKIRRSYIKKERIPVKVEEYDEEDEEMDENGDIRRSKRGRKPKKTYSPEKIEEKKSARKRSLAADREEASKSVKRGKYERKSGKVVKDSEKEESEDSSAEESMTEYEGEEEGESESENDFDEEEEEESSSSSSAEDSEDEYQPSSVARKGKGRRILKDNFKTPNGGDLNDEEVLEKIKNGEIPETFVYRSDSHSIFIPKLRPDMIGGTGKDVSIQSIPAEFFKFKRVRQKTKQDHADPQKVRELIRAIRKTPIIWDQRLSCHQNKILVRRAWIRIDQELGEDDEYSLNRRRQIWKNKKDYYLNIVQTDLERQWMFIKDFEFYEPMVHFRTANIKEKKANNEKLVLGNMSLTCKSDDKSNVMKFLLKSIHDFGMCDEKLMMLHQNSIKNIFETNFKNISAKYSNVLSK
ncbi:unnamed protein product [Caenorhabditis angaria]|uniref:MADF domain-containing protein n=1 Tax=Caenorhabditis angaria TaxID=860376 RepID=A0A9P1IJ29_9PELO|nr:unnamed protein product [Caenorhabditis angaria]